MPLSYVERAVTRKIRIRIRGEEAVIQNPLFAINWFDTRAAFVYHLYNMIAGPRAFKVGAKALFKGKYQRTLYGNPSLQRNYLLIVNYPSANHFLDLASDKVFQIFSVLRIAAVKRFSFVLQQRHHGEQLLKDRVPKGSKQGHYAVVQISASPQNSASANSIEATSPVDLASAIGSLAEQNDVDLFYAGSAAGRVSTVAQDDQESALLAITEHTLVFSATSEKALSDLLGSSEFQSLIGISDQSNSLEEGHVFAATLKRLM